MSKAILVTEMPKKCIDCPLVYKEDYFIYRCKVSEDQVDSNGIYFDCPLRPSSDYIPIEWIKKWQANHTIDGTTRNLVVFHLLYDWEKENE